MTGATDAAGVIVGRMTKQRPGDQTAAAMIASIQTPSPIVSNGQLDWDEMPGEADEPSYGHSDCHAERHRISKLRIKATSVLSTKISAQPRGPSLSAAAQSPSALESNDLPGSASSQQ